MRRVVQASCSGIHTCILLEDGSVFLFGDNKFGQCDVPNLRGHRVVQAVCGIYHTCLLLDDGSVCIFGNN